MDLSTFENENSRSRKRSLAVTKSDTDMKSASRGLKVSQISYYAFEPFRMSLKLDPQTSK